MDTEGKTGDESVEEIRQDNERAKARGNNVKPAGFSKEEPKKPTERVLSEEEIKALDNFIEPAFESVEEAQKALSENGIEFKPDNIDGESYRKQATWLLKQLEDMSDLPSEFKDDVLNYIGKIEVTKTDDKEGGNAGHGMTTFPLGKEVVCTMRDNPDKVGIKLNKTDFSSREAIDTMLEEERGDLRSVPNFTEESILAHETGHATIYALTEKETGGYISVPRNQIYDKDGNQLDNNKSMLPHAQISREIVKAAVKEYNELFPEDKIEWDNPDDLARVLSVRGAKDCVETVAEGLGECSGGPEPRIFARLIQKHTNRRIRKAYNVYSF
ncbi:MAG: hypothetical protein IJT09_03330 [Abditibacteriota bacterium]|nr:hypothetical protein [Abditibacteriota bacterium]